MREERGEEERKRVHPSSPERPGKAFTLREGGASLFRKRETAVCFTNSSPKIQMIMFP